jgi:hypothetical protein
VPHIVPMMQSREFGNSNRKGQPANLNSQTFLSSKMSPELFNSTIQSFFTEMACYVAYTANPEPNDPP